MTSILPSVRRLNLSIFLFVVGFILFGVLMVYNVSVVESYVTFSDPYYFLRSQALWATLSLGSLLILSRIPVRLWQVLGPLLFAIAVLLLVLVLIPSIGVKIGGARRWLSIAGFSLQPSEVMKMGLILYLSTWLQKPRRFLAFALLTSGIFGLIMLQPDLGSGLIILSIAIAMYVCAGKPLKHLLWFGSIGAIGITLLVLFSPYRMQRLTTFLNPESDPQGKSYHIRQITLALGNGGIFGQGLGRSMQKYRYIPEATTDSIFAIIAEELGFVACGMIIIGYIVLCGQMSKKAAMCEPGSQHQLLAVGIMTWLTAQVLVNLSSVVALIPLTGVPLPFISYGGTALLTLTSAIGVFIGIPVATERVVPNSTHTRVRRRQRQV